MSAPLGQSTDGQAEWPGRAAQLHAELAAEEQLRGERAKALAIVAVVLILGILGIALAGGMRLMALDPELSNPTEQR